ncbi:hypothetical protein ORV05_07950 [Amycolatopsis cynarae]|uniref:Uncharacterized protein n=1 Tax=Amycolatopsis cynarae TaxID=2995223 RepID=A0ABY7B5U4_9PSEU|nr:hypothetical protein [Amycolatopsis sp. HUAS 11-8]WAL67699.1 hypothetical protein ORV05_07950 [Amycolatopsis sp. HUAS 11-8]
MNPEDLRGAALGALHGLYLPTATDDLAMIMALGASLVVAPEALAELASADHADFLAGVERPSWICPALEYEGGRPNDEFLTRSDWPMRARVVREVLSESQELLLLKRFCDLAISLAERRETRPSASLDRLHERIDDLSIHLPSDRLAEKKAEREPPDDLSVHRELAEDRHGELVREERIAQAQVIAALDRLTPPERYFGVQ